MDDDFVYKKAGPLSYLGCGCGGIGALILLAGLGTIGGILGGAFNDSVEAQAWAGGGSGACCGLVALIIGIVLYYVGKKPVIDDD